MIEMCRDCKFFVGSRNKNYDYMAGECHRHAPVVKLQLCSHDFENKTVYPPVKNDDGCGDFERLENEQ